MKMAKPDEFPKPPEGIYFLRFDGLSDKVVNGQYGPSRQWDFTLVARMSAMGLTDEFPKGRAASVGMLINEGMLPSPANKLGQLICALMGRQVNPDEEVPDPPFTPLIGKFVRAQIVCQPNAKGDIWPKMQAIAIPAPDEIAALGAFLTKHPPQTAAASRGSAPPSNPASAADIRARVAAVAPAPVSDDDLPF